jgi:heme exporter protein D
MQYFGYIFASYAATVIVFGALIGWVVLDQRGRLKELEELEDQGVRRRSDAASKVERHS